MGGSWKIPPPLPSSLSSFSHTKRKREREREEVSPGVSKQIPVGRAHLTPLELATVCVRARDLILHTFFSNRTNLEICVFFQVDLQVCLLCVCVCVKVINRDVSKEEYRI